MALRDGDANLGGTARTLDDIDGALPLENGVLAYDGVAMVDDTTTVLFDESGWIAPRRPGNLDLYVFAWGRDYKRALRSLYALTGPTPLLPRYALGNWWSRYHPYTADEYLALMDRFRDEDVPLSVSVIDMDWHLVDIDPEHGSGWTGYSWNTDLFPDPQAFLAGLHERGLAVSLNVHPAEGVHAHEASYAAIAQRMGIDPDSRVPVAFDPTDPDFLRGLLRGAAPPARGRRRRLLVAGLAAGRRHPDPRPRPAVAAQPLPLPRLRAGREAAADVLAVRRDRQPPLPRRVLRRHPHDLGVAGLPALFTATASNAGYGWWSHDIGGHFKGYKDDELTTRWVQLGVFSPILRLHSGLNPFNTREPWRFDSDSERVMTTFLRLRHQLLPYLATMNVRAHEGEPIVQPMYYDHPEAPEAYASRTSSCSARSCWSRRSPRPATRHRSRSGDRLAARGHLGRRFTGVRYAGGRMLHLHRDLDSIPVLARAGAIVPMVPAPDVCGGTDLPSRVEVRVYAGADGEFTLVEDRDDERWVRTRMTWDDAAGELTVHDPEGDLSSLPGDRTYDVVVVAGDADVAALLFTLLDRTKMPFELKEKTYDVVRAGADAAHTVPALQALELEPALFGALTELVLAHG